MLENLGRVVGLCAAVLAGLLTIPTPVRAQYLALLPSSKPALDIRNVPAGAWSLYQHQGAHGTDLQRFVLVGDAPEGRLLEVSVESQAFLQPMVFRFVVPPHGDRAGPSPLELQIGTGPRMRAMLASGASFPDFLAPSARVGTARARLGSTTLKVTRYLHRAGEDVWEYSVSEQAPPLGFVESLKRLGSTSSRLRLLQLGTGGKSRMTGEPRPVDGAELLRQLEANLRRSPR